MRQRRKPTNWFLVIFLALLIAVVVYLDRFVVPTVQPPFMPTPTATRNPESYATEANGLFTQGKLSQAIDVYNEAISINPSDPSLYIALAQVQAFAGKYDDALTSARNALLLNPNNSMAQAVLGWAETQKDSLAQTPDYTDADTSIKRALQLDSNNGLAHAYYAFLLGDMDQYNTGPYSDPIRSAIAESNTAISLAPNSLEAHWARGFILQITGNYEQSIPEYQAAISQNGNIAKLHLELGATYKYVGDIDKAIQEYTRANTLDPTDPTASLYSSRALGQIGEYEKAVQYAQQAVTDSPTDPYLRGNLGVWLYKVPNWVEALPQLALAINGGKTDDGQTILPQPLTGSDAHIAQYYYTYAILLAKYNRCSEALPITQLLLTTVPDDADAVYNAQYAQSVCSTSLGTPAPTPSSTPKVTPTP
ncbi:MAG: tetratricopeptide repeat protein [Anaerolineales bacterium]